MNNWYCHHCRYYLNPVKIDSPNVDAVSKRSILDLMKIIVGSISVIAIFLIAAGVFQFFISSDNNSYYNDDNIMIARGFLNTLIGIILLLITFFYINITLAKKEWWNRMQLFIDFQSKASEGAMAMKRSLVMIYQIFYGSIILLGIILLLMGILFINTFSEGNVLIFSSTQAVLGIALIFLSYLKYRNNMEMLSRDIYPILFPKEPKSDEPIPPPPLEK